MAERYDITIEKGATWSLPLHWFDEPIGGQISNTVANPTVVTTTVAHGLTTGDAVFIQGSNSLPSIGFVQGVQSGIHTVTVINTTTFSVPVNVTMAGNSGTVKPAIDLTGYSARMKVKDSYGGAELLSLTNGTGITLGTVDGLVTVSRSATETAAFSWTRGVYDLELVNGTDVTRLVEGSVTVKPEAST